MNSPTPSFMTIEFPNRGGSAVGKVETYVSSLKSKDLSQISRAYNFPPSAILAVPRKEDRACWPPLGFVTVYEDSLRGGLHVPYPTIYSEVQYHLGIPVAQLSPNVIHQITALGVLSHRHKFPVALGLVSHFFFSKKQV